MYSAKSILYLIVLATLAAFTNACVESGVTCTGKLIKIHGASTTSCGDSSECSEVCSEYDECVAWTYNVNSNKCSIYATRTGTKKNSKYVTGSRDCDGETTSEGNTPAPTLAPTAAPTECSTWQYGMFVGSGDEFMLSIGGIAEPEDCEALCAAETDFACVCWSHHRNGASKNRICELYETRPTFVEQPQSSKWTSGPFDCPTASPTIAPTDAPITVEELTPAPTPAPIYQCLDKQLDILWILDNSWSIDQNEGNGSAVLQDLLPRLADAYNLSQSETRFSGLAYSTNIRGVTSADVNSSYPLDTKPFDSTYAVSPFNFQMSQSTNEGGTWDAFASKMKAMSTTNTPLALQAAKYIMGLDESAGGPRQDEAVKIVILLTDGSPNMRAKTECGDIPADETLNSKIDQFDMACTEWLVYELINKLGVYFIDVQIGGDVDESFLNYCISNPESNNGQPLPLQTIKATFENIQETVDSIIQASCIDSSFKSPQNIVFNYETANSCASAIESFF